MELMRLSQIAGAQNKGFDTTALETDFLRFSQYNQERTLNIKRPKMYELQGEQIVHIQKALDFLGIKTDGRTPQSVDISGRFDYSDRGLLMFFSPSQLDADHITRSGSHLNPLLERIYAEGSKLVTEFSIHETVLGRLSYKRGELDLRQVHLFPERFKPGKYSISTDLDTPSGYISKFIKFSDALKEFDSKPKESLLNALKVNEIANLGLQLRSNLGSLSRYSVPDNKRFSVETNSCVLDISNNPLFYLYSESQEKNILVYFGKNPFRESAPFGLTVLNGDEHQATLVKLVELDIFRPSRTVLGKKIIDLTAIHDGAKISSSFSSDQFNNLERLLGSLRDIESSLNSMDDISTRKEYLLRQSPELLEFMVYPSSDDPIVFDLLPRVSWNEGIRFYNNSSRFISEFSKADDFGKKKILEEVAANSMPGNYQNNDVNLYLYDNHRDFCSTNGIGFNII